MKKVILWSLVILIGAYIVDAVYLYATLPPEVKQALNGPPQVKNTGPGWKIKPPLLHRLIESGDIKAIEEELLKKPASIDIPGKDEYAFTPLFFAVASERIDIVKLLIDKGADVNIAYEDAQGQTPLMFTTL